ncbi:Nuclease PA3, putative [Perkinsus marinus ATCC 50983]|uniref:Nuclease PA3, putative n=1 Tax=Perkinsus marinus (strain ATCC 50983 / TXsc) TaxID=423536 RepID=C5KMC3_PERM5|nr:Nuclease PA3, putative [Perkinsus marinus ATCC 50983]EER14377.1 Nuclease PA3, putative [Perkinsus marinus ATCC 50983]|eukprot:XP_002782582.1 Nuclease PA3, putative [Perkinsus marinus ATCC 50983]
MPTLVFVITLFFVREASCWGPDGHAVVAELADTRMSSKARKWVYDIMGEGYRLATSASWADSILYGNNSGEWSWSKPLHYANVDDCEFVYARDCPNNVCVAGAIKNYTAQLTNTSLTKEQRQDAVKFLVHFMGDVHEPLNAGRYTDLGGNTISVAINFADYEKTNLHKVWGEKLIDEYEGELYPGPYIQQDADYNKDRTQYWSVSADEIGRGLASGGKYAGKVPSWKSKCESLGIDVCVNEMVQESATLACNQAYVNVDGSQIGNDDGLLMGYYTSRIETVKEQLAKGAVRLAWVLDNTFDNFTTTTPQPPTSTTTTISSTSQSSSSPTTAAPSSTTTELPNGAFGFSSNRICQYVLVGILVVVVTL